ncbi:hypothetical protein EC991_003064 [Linnemannia zychae]|nr:hypothetical protein EC991_003064 [Linnemannia zychae]
MSPFDIPELIESIAFHLNIHDMTQCALVNKIWNNLFTPFIWHTVPPHTAYTRPQPWERWDTWDNFAIKEVIYELLVLEEKEEEEHMSSARNTQEQQQLDQSVSGSRGKWHLIKDLDIHQFSFAERSMDEYYGHLEPKPEIPHHINEEVMLRFLELCTGVQSLRAVGQCWTQADLKFWGKVLSLSCSNSAVSSDIDNSGNSNFSYNARKASIKDLVIALLSPVIFEISPIAGLIFSRCSQGLQKLSLHISNESVDEGLLLRREEKTFNGKIKDNNNDSQAEEVSDAPAEEEQLLPGMRELSVTFEDLGSFPPTWPQFLGGCVGLRSLTVQIIEQSWSAVLASCPQLERLEVLRVTESMFPILAHTIKDSLPNMNEIKLKTFVESVPDKELALLLSAGRAGWRVVDFPILGVLSAEVLIERHCHTLESFHVIRATEQMSAYLVKILSCSPRLHTFVTLDAEQLKFSHPPFIAAKDFIDINTSTGNVEPWQSESTLKDFRVKITGIPRPDLTHTFHHNPLREGMVTQESFPGECAKLQRQVYERLAGFSRLEQLSLGLEEREAYSWDRMSGELDHTWDDDEKHQYSCLAMSLESGLEILAGLKGLKELNIARMATAVGVEEVQWMTQNWPRLRNLSGLNYSVKKEVDAAQWLLQSAPFRIHAQTCQKL